MALRSQVRASAAKWRYAGVGVSPASAFLSKFHPATPPMFYSAYNLFIRSDLALPELAAGDRGGDVEIRLAPSGSPVKERTLEWQDSPEPRAVMSFPGAGTFEIRNGREITITPDPGADPGLLRLYVQGMMLAAILHQRGHFVLHSSVVNIAGSAIALIGTVGAGKSSTAAALHARGHSIVADDNAAIDVASPEFDVLPAFPVLKLYPAIAESLGYQRNPCMHASHGKQAQSVSISDAPLSLKTVYVLDREAPEEIARLSAIEAVTEFIRHSVPTRWGATGDGNHLRKCVQLAAQLPVYRVRSFTLLSELPALASALEAHSARHRPLVAAAEAMEALHA
jgi:HPr Serine kinase C-terminal domain